MNKSHKVSIASPEYRQFIEDLKTRVVSARIFAARAVSLDLILLYWDIGRGYRGKQQSARLGRRGRRNGRGRLAAGFSADDGLFAAQCVGHAPTL